MGVLNWGYQDRGQVQTDENNVGTIMDRIMVLMSDPADTLPDLQVGLPQFQNWQRHPTANGYYVNGFLGLQRDHTPHWECTVNYTNGLVANPLTIPAQIGEIRTFDMPGATILDAFGAPIVNTAGELVEPFDKPEKVIAYPLIKNISGLGDWLFNFEACINSDAVRLGSFVCAPRTLLMNSIQISAQQTQANITYRTATCEVWMRQSEWATVWPSRGYNQVSPIRTGSNKKILMPIVLPSNDKPDTPQFLDRNGAWLQNPTPSQLWLIKTQIYPSVPFASFPLK